MALYNDYDALLERFSIMTESPTANYTAAIEYCTQNTTPELANRLKKEVTSFNNSVIENLIKTYKDLTAKGKDGNEILNNWKQTTPCDIYTKVLQALNLPEPATRPQHADFETLSKYINAGFELYPCTFINGKYLPITLNGKIALYDTDEQKQAKDRHGITDKSLLQELCNQTKTIKDEHGHDHAITLFRIFPIDNRYIVIDIDTHEGHANGLVQWQNYTKSRNLNGYYKDLQQFPCFTESANGGKHLYFKIPYELPQKIKNIATSIEVGTKDHGETAAGSYRNGTKNGYYILHGSLENAPILPLQIYKDMQPEPPRPAIAYNKAPAGTTTAKWNTTADGIIEKARQKHGNEKPHDFAYWICKYFDMANKEGGNYTKNEIENILFSLPEMSKHDRNDTHGVINSFIF